MAMCLCFFFILSLSFSIHTQARDTHFFSKFSHQQVTKPAKKVDTDHESNVMVSPAQSPKAAVEEHGYGLYGGGNTRYPPMTVDPVKTGYGVGKETPFVSMEELRNENGNKNEYVTERQGMSDTRFLENGKYYYDVNRDAKEKQGMNAHVVDESSYPEYPRNGNNNEYVAERQGVSDTRFPEENDVGRDFEDENTYSGNGYVTEKQGMRTHVRDENSYPETRRNGNQNEYVAERQGVSDTRFPEENGQYYNDVGRDFEDENTYNGNGYVTEKQGMRTHVGDENSYPENRRNGNKNKYVTERQGMSDTRFLENGKYYYDVSQDENTYNRNGFVAEKQGLILDENSYPQGNGNKNAYATERQGMSDTRFSDNGKSYYDVNRDFKDNGYVSEKQGRSTHAVDKNSYPVTERQGMSDTRFLENGRYYYDVNKDVKNENSNPDNDQYFDQSTEDNEFDSNNAYEKGYYGGNNRGKNYKSNGNTKKLPPNQYDTMEEYDKEEEYRLSQQYKP